jgi:hypothetical protein
VAQFHVCASICMENLEVTGTLNEYIGVAAGIRVGYLPKASQERSCLSELGWCFQSQCSLYSNKE